MFRRLFVLLILSAIVAGGVVFVWLRFTAPKPGELDNLQNGDLVFQTRKALQAIPVVYVTDSPYSLVGIIKQAANGPVVVNGIDMVGEMPLATWMKYGAGDRIVVKRVRGMTPAIAASILAAIQTSKGKIAENLPIHFTKDSVYSSKLVYEAFLTGAKVKIGRIQRLWDLNVDNVFINKLFELRGQGHPLCQTAETANYTVCVDLILNQELITPASIAADPRLDTIYDNYGWLASLVGNRKSGISITDLNRGPATQ